MIGPRFVPARSHTAAAADLKSYVQRNALFQDKGCWLALYMSRQPALE